MAAHQDHCGTFVVDPYDLETECCMHVGEPVRPHEVAAAKLDVTNHEESTVTGVINYALTDARTGEIVDPLPEKSIEFELAPGQTKEYRMEVKPEDASVLHTRIQEYDDEFIGSIWYSLENVRSPDEKKTHSGGHSVPPNNPDGV